LLPTVETVGYDKELEKRIVFKVATIKALHLTPKFYSLTIVIA